MLIKATCVNRLEIGLRADVLTSNVIDASGAATMSVQGKRFSYT